MLFQSLVSEVLYYTAIICCAYITGWWYFKTKRNDFIQLVNETTSNSICLFDSQIRSVECNQHWAVLIDKLGLSNFEKQSHLREFLNYLAAYDTHGAAQLTEAIISVTSGQESETSASYSLPIDNNVYVIQARLTKSRSLSDRFALSMTDITEQAFREQKLRSAIRQSETMSKVLEANQQSLELAVQGGKIGLWHWDVDTGYFELSRSWYKLLGHPELGYDCEINQFCKLIHPDDESPFKVDSFDIESGKFNSQFRLNKQDGTDIWVELIGSITSRSDHGQPQSISGVLVDIHDRKVTDLRDAAYRKVIDESINEIYLVDAETFKFIEVNRGACKNLGYEMAELAEMTPGDISTRSMEDIQETISVIVKGEADRIEFETSHRRKDDSTYPLFLTVQKTEYLGREAMLAIGMDISKRHELEKQLRQAQKLESIGQLAAGVAHEINTPLQSVSCNIEFLSQTTHSMLEVLHLVDERIEHAVSLDDFSSAKEDLHAMLVKNKTMARCDQIPEAIDESSEALRRVLEILKAMKEYSHPGDEFNGKHCINQAIRTSATVTKNRWKNVGKLDLELDESLPEVACNIGTINQVIVNFIVNAVDAIEERYQDDAYSNGNLVVRSYKVGEEAAIEVSDNGCGIPKHIVRKIYDPFFTTKDVGKGTGQGLSYCHNAIVNQHQGSLDVESDEGDGTVFLIKLPFVHKSPTTCLSSESDSEHTTENQLSTV